MPEVAVIGAGIAGLTAAYHLHRQGLEVTLFEAHDRVGGVIRSERSEGFLVEHGPNSIQSKSPAVERLVGDLGLESEVVTAAPAARNRYIVRDGRPQAAPLSPVKLVKSGLFGGTAKLRLLREPFVPPADPSTEESVADFVRRRLGQEFLDYGMNPFVAGVYAGDPDRLSVRYALPSLYESEQTSGSIIKGQMERRGRAASATETHRMYSFTEGLAQLPQAIGNTLGDRVRLSTPAVEIARENGRWRVNSAAFEAVVFAAPLHRLEDVRLPAEFRAAPLQDVVYAPLSVIALGYRREAVEHSLDGFGVLVPEVESSFRILGTLFTSSIFPGRAPTGHVLLTTFVGGMRHPKMAREPAGQLYESVHRDLARLLDISEAPVFRRHVYWKKSIPQYNLGYGDVLDAIERLESKLTGLFMAGNYRSGIAVGDAAESGEEAARRCRALLSAT